MVVCVSVCVACLPLVSNQHRHRIASHPSEARRRGESRKKKLGIVTTRRLSLIHSLSPPLGSFFFLELRAGDDVMALLVASPLSLSLDVPLPGWFPQQEKRRDIGRLGRKRYRFFLVFFFFFFYMLDGCGVVVVCLVGVGVF